MGSAFAGTQTARFLSAIQHGKPEMVANCGNLPCDATFSPLFRPGEVCFRASRERALTRGASTPNNSLFKGITSMRKIALLAAASAAALSLAACSEKTQETAEATGESMAADAQTNADAAGQAVADTAETAGDAVADTAEKAADKVEEATDSMTEEKAADK
jgi:hypothetical protein